MPDGNGKDNKRSNKNPFAKMFRKKEDKSDDSKQQQQQQQQSMDANEAMLKYLENNGLYEGVDIKEFIEAVREGNVEDAGKIFMKSIQNAAIVSISAGKKLMDAKVAASSEEIFDKTKDTNKREMARKQMNDNLSFTTQEHFAVTANQVLDGFIDQGFSVDEAIKNTESYFKDMAKEMGFKLPSDGKGQRKGTKGFKNESKQNANNSPNDDVDLTDEDNLDFVDVFTGGAQSFDDLNAAQRDKQQQSQQQSQQDQAGAEGE